MYLVVEGEVKLLQRRSVAYRIGVYIVVVAYMSCLCTEDMNIYVSGNNTHEHRISHINLRIKLHLMTLFGHMAFHYGERHPSQTLRYCKDYKIKSSEW